MCYTFAPSSLFSKDLYNGNTKSDRVDSRPFQTNCCPCPTKRVAPEFMVSCGILRWRRWRGGGKEFYFKPPHSSCDNMMIIQQEPLSWPLWPYTDSFFKGVDRSWIFFLFFWLKFFFFFADYALLLCAHINTYIFYGILFMIFFLLVHLLQIDYANIAVNIFILYVLSYWFRVR